MKYIETDRLILKEPSLDYVPHLLDYLKRNREFLLEWEPARDDSYYTIESAKNSIKSLIDNNKSLSGLSLYIFNKGEDKIIGSISASNIVYGPFLSCFLGYKLDKDEINKGKMTESIKAFINILFKEYKLHRVEANIIPRNLPSVKAVTKVGFTYEGSSKKYLKINGVWEDHGHYVLLNKDVE